MNAIDNLLQDNSGITSFKQLAENISDESIIKRIQGFSTYPSVTNEYSKIVEFGNIDFLTDVKVQERIETLIFTEEQLEDVTAEEYMYAMTYAYNWVYGMKNIDNEYKKTPNTENLNLALKRKDIKDIESKDDSYLFELAGVKEEKLSDWEKELVKKQIEEAILNPFRTSMGLLSSGS